MPAALDIEQPGPLVEWLKSTGRLRPDEEPSVRVLAGGVSNRTVLVRRESGESWVLKQALEQLRVAVEWKCPPGRIRREAEGMRWLATMAPPGAITPFLFEDRALHILGMRAVPEPHVNWKTMLLEGRVGTEELRQFGQLLGTIHRRAKVAGGRLRELFADRSYFEILRLEPFYEYTATRHRSAAGFFGRLAAETRALAVTLVHGDYSPKNILVYRGQLVLLDHEVIHWGDPMFDVGFALAHLLTKAHHVRTHREAFAGAAILFWEHYQFALCHCMTLDGAVQRAVRHAMGCLLARASGRSPVEYLSPAARQRQADVVLALLDQPPQTVVELTDAFLDGVARREVSES